MFLAIGFMWFCEFHKLMRCVACVINKSTMRGWQSLRDCHFSSSTYFHFLRFPLPVCHLIRMVFRIDWTAKSRGCVATWKTSKLHTCRHLSGGSPPTQTNNGIKNFPPIKSRKQTASQEGDRAGWLIEATHLRNTHCVWFEPGNPFAEIWETWNRNRPAIRAESNGQQLAGQQVTPSWPANHSGSPLQVH